MREQIAAIATAGTADPNALARLSIALDRLDGLSTRIADRRAAKLKTLEPEKQRAHDAEETRRKIAGRITALKPRQP